MICSKCGVEMILGAKMYYLFGSKKPFISRSVSWCPLCGHEQKVNTLRNRLYDKTIMGRGLMWAHQGTRRFLVKRRTV